MLDDHAPYQRVIRDETNATDRQWLRMMFEAFDGVSYDDMVKAGLNHGLATHVLGLIALNVRIEQH